MKKSISLAMALAVMLTSVLLVPQAGSKAEAAAKAYISPYDTNQTVYYEPDCYDGTWKTSIYIRNCSKATQIKSLKSSNKSIARVVARQGYIDVYYYKKPGKVNITCTVNGTKLKASLTVKKYSSPVKTFKVGSKNFASKFKGAAHYDYYHTAKINKQALTLKANSGWVIDEVQVYKSNNGFKYYKDINKSSYTLKNLTLNGKYDEITVYFYNKKSKLYIPTVLNLKKE